MPAAPRLSRLGDLVIDQDLGFQKRSWRAQRFGQIAIGLLVLAALLGAFGRGWLARRAVEAPGLRVIHPRFLRLQAPDEIIVRLDSPAEGARQMEVELWIDDSLADFLELTDMTPQPTAQSVRDGRPTFRFMLAGAAPATLRFRVKPRAWGWRVGSIGRADGASVELRQFVYP